MSKKGAEVVIPLKLQLETDSAMKDLKKFANDTKADISGFNSAKKILDDLEKSVNKAFDGKNADKFSAKILKIEQAASSAATKLLKMGDQYKAVWERQQTREQWSGREGELQSKIAEFKAQREALLNESRQLETLVSKGIVNEEYYDKMSRGANKARAELQRLNEEKIKLEQSGGKGSDEWKRITEAMTSARRAIGGYHAQMKKALDPQAQEQARVRWQQIDQELSDLAAKAKEYTDIIRVLLTTSQDEGFLQNWERLVTIIKSAELEVENFKHSEDNVGKGGGMNTARQGFYLMRTIIRDMEKGLRKLSDKMSQFASKVADAVKNMFNLNKESKKTTNSLQGGFKKALSYLLRYGLGIRSLFFLFRRLRKYVIEALGEMAKEFPEVNKQMSRAVTAMNQMKGSLGTLVQPLLNVLVPALEKIAAVVTKIINLVASLFALLTGQKTIKVAVATNTDYAASLDKTGKSAKKAKKELEGYLSPIDEINKYKEKNDDDDDSSSGGGDGGAGYKFIDQAINPLAQKIKDLLDRILGPIKEAWAEIGPLVVASWKRALNSVKKLLEDIGRDMLKVWEQPETLEMLKNVLRIIANIGDVVHFLAKNLDEAWNKNDIGLHILEKIRDIFAIIIEHIESATDATVEWAKNLDFYPLLEAIDGWLESLKPVVDNIMGVLEDFYTQVLLPLSKWAIEEGGPKLLGVFEDFNNKVDWEGLRSKLSELWDHLEPFAERVGEGLIQFIDDISEKLADFLNSDTLSNFIDKLGEWMDNITADDVRSGLWDLVNAFVAIKVALYALSILGNVAVAIKEVAIALKAIEGLGGLGAVATALAGIAAVVGGMIMSVKEFFTMWTNGWDGLSTILEALGIALVAIGAILLGAPAAVAAAVAGIIFAVSQITIAVHDNWDKIVAYYNNTIKPVIDSLIAFIKSILNIIVDTFKMIVNSFKQHIVPLWNRLTASLKSFVSTYISPLVDAIMRVVKPMIDGLKIWIYDILWVSVLKPLLSWLIDRFFAHIATKVEFVWNLIKTAVSVISTGVTTVLNVLGSLLQFVVDVFTVGWDQAWENLKENFIEIWETLKSQLKGIVNAMIDIVNSMLDMIGNGINDLLSAINTGLTWLADHGGPDWGTITLVDMPHIPHLAQGAVIPPNKEFMAMLGDQKSGTNIETPLSTMVEAFNTALRQNGGGGVKQINFVLPDRRTLAQYTIAGGRIIQTSTGKNPFELA